MDQKDKAKIKLILLYEIKLRNKQCNLTQKLIFRKENYEKIEITLDDISFGVIDNIVHMISLN